jgi:hypothetical protein
MEFDIVKKITDNVSIFIVEKKKKVLVKVFLVKV